MGIPLTKLPSGDFTFRHDEDTVTVLKRFVKLHKLRNVGVMGIYEEHQIQGIDRLVVHIKRQYDPASRSCKYDSILLFLVIRCNGRLLALEPQDDQTQDVHRDHRQLCVKI